MTSLKAFHTNEGSGVSQLLEQLLGNRFILFLIGIQNIFSHTRQMQCGLNLSVWKEGKQHPLGSVCDNKTGDKDVI